MIDTIFCPTHTDANRQIKRGTVRCAVGRKRQADCIKRAPLRKIIRPELLKSMRAPGQHTARSIERVSKGQARA
jgi:hypothetical protein